MNPKTLSGEEIGSPLLSFLEARSSRCFSSRRVASVSDFHMSTKSCGDRVKRSKDVLIECVKG